ncbi:MAG: YiiD C-terminal domain-containing protein [Aquimonas sp.]|jgi:thioesterase domain-containing protein|nr:YiiD C-terminal domain-containing protein [Aquimonas sp.]
MHSQPHPPSATEPFEPALRAQLQSTLSAMPPLRAIGCNVLDATHEHLLLGAPLALNINDKGNAFGGSMASLMTVACWGLFNLHLQRAGIHAEVYVQDSQIRYLTPVYEDLRACAQATSAAAWDEALTILREKGKSRIAMRAAIVLADGREAATLEARFVALRPAAK